MNVELIKTSYPDVTVIYRDGKRIGSIVGNPEKHNHFQCVGDGLEVRGSEFWTGFSTYQEAVNWFEGFTPIATH